ncbi:hypothetical protein PIB30_086674 [Stylosanthes scabra]|uniref:Uncharacterized protein n=1 Tax=Stylosanthes scabra TaxID=79078 RepID=A0ABU6RT41_9FABA|nr:hypothetical protein [Stylosanthes scabra]
MKQGTVRSHGPIVQPHVSLGAFWDAFCQYSRDRAGAKSKLQSLLTVQPHHVPRDRTVPSGRTKIKAKNGISNFRARLKALARPNSTYMKEKQLKHKTPIPIRSMYMARHLSEIVVRVYSNGVPREGPDEVEFHSSDQVVCMMWHVETLSDLQETVLTSEEYEASEANTHHQDGL